MKQIIAVFASLLLLAVPPAQAQFNYTTNNGTITITGYTGPGGPVAIPANINGLTVTGIGSLALVESSVTQVSIPSTITSISSGSLGGCADLTAITVDAQNPAYSSTNGILFDKSGATLLLYPGGIAGNYTIPGNVTAIGNYAFYYANGITGLVIGSNVTSIGILAFRGSHVSSVVIPGSIPSIAEEAFAYCTNLTNVTIAAGVGGIGDSAFLYCSNLAAVAIPNTVTSIGEDAFDQCAKLTRVTIPNGVTNIGTFAFLYCTGLTNATIGRGISSTGIGMFYGCSALADIALPAGVTFIAEETFEECSNLAGVTIPPGVTNIGQDAFAACTSLTNIAIPASVTNLGDYVFSGCTNLMGAFFEGEPPGGPITLPETLFENDPKATAYYLPGTTGWTNTFAGVPAVLWNPLIQTHDGSLGVRGNQFGFNVTGTTNIPIVVQACSSLANPVWTSLTNVNIPASGVFHFSELFQSNVPARFYRISSP